MKTFKSISDVLRVRNDTVHDIVKRLLSPFITDPSYRPEDDGYLVLIERDDVDRAMNDLNIPHRLSEVPFEAVRRLGSYFLASFVPNNQFVLSFLIPDEPWIDGALRSHLESHIDP